MASKKARTYQVTGAVAIARLAGGGERYLYQGAVLSGDEYDEAHIQHLLDNRLIAAAPVEPSGNSEELEPATDGDEPKTPPETPEGDTKADKKK